MICHWLHNATISTAIVCTPTSIKPITILRMLLIIHLKLVLLHLHLQWFLFSRSLCLQIPSQILLVLVRRIILLLVLDISSVTMSYELTQLDRKDG